MGGISKAWTRTKGRNGKAYLRVRAGKCRNEYVHTLVAEAMLGRELVAGECVDHRDGDGFNDRPWNLRVMTVIGNSRRKDQPPLKGEVIFDGAAWWKQRNPDWVDPLGLV